MPKTPHYPLICPSLSKKMSSRTILAGRLLFLNYRFIPLRPAHQESIFTCQRHIGTDRGSADTCGSTYVHRAELGDVVGNETGSGEYRCAVRRGHASGLVRRPGQYRHGSRTEEARSRTLSCATRRRARTTSWSARLAGPPAIHRNERTCVVEEVNCST